MEYRTQGKIVKGVGGLYTIELSDAEAHRKIYGNSESVLAGKLINCHAKGAFRYENVKPYVGDNVEVTYSDMSFSFENGEPVPDANGSGIVISRILDRKNSLIRPPIANVDYMFVTMAAASPEPMLDTVDRTVAILEYNNIEPVIVIGKSELDCGRADMISEIYRTAGFDVFVLSCAEKYGIEKLKEYINEKLLSHTAAFCGASGVGKSTLINTLFPEFELTTAAISRKTERGRHTTRCTELFSVQVGAGKGYIADTPGFSMLDFERFDFLSKEDLPSAFREMRQYIGKCRYTKCSHTKEQGCAVIEAVHEGKIPKSRHDSFVELYEILKTKKEWNRK